MTYEEFKKELCRNVQNMETAQDKTICLLEQHMVCSDPETVHIMNIMNRCMYGRDNMLIKDDMLCALWIRQEKEYVQHWLVRQKQSGRHLTAAVHHGFRKQLLLRKPPGQYRIARGSDEQTASTLLTDQQMKYQRQISDLAINGIPKVQLISRKIHRTYDHMTSARRIT